MILSGTVDLDERPGKMLLECSRQICRVLNCGPFRAVVLVLQKEEHRHPHQADEDSAKHHRSVSNERVQNFF
jgi:hypothetical protein